MERLICFITGWSIANIAEGFVLNARGTIVEEEVRDFGRDLDADWSPLDKDGQEVGTGLLVWEGVAQNASCKDHGDDWQPDFHGRWRRPTPDEMVELCADVR